MKIIISLSFIISLILSCHIRNELKVTKHITQHRPIPNSILAKYLKKTNLKSLESGVDSFELRIWHQFYYVDSFPLVLERCYYKQNSFNTEFYIFSLENNGILKTISDLPKLKFEKYTLLDLPLRYLDSLRKNHDFSKIAELDINTLQEKINSSYNISTQRYTLLEQATRATYDAFFLPNPLGLRDIDAGLNKCALLEKYCMDSLFLRDTKFREWFESKMTPILSNDNSN